MKPRRFEDAEISTDIVRSERESTPIEGVSMSVTDDNIHLVHFDCPCCGSDIVIETEWLISALKGASDQWEKAKEQVMKSREESHGK